MSSTSDENKDIQTQKDPDIYPAYLYDSRLPNRHVRLLQILPGKDEDAICCEVTMANLDSDPVFEALSYTWGSNLKSSSLICGGKRLNITNNLFDALWQFRKSGIHWPIWIDAVCINQEDIMEKTSQVKMMLQIYQRATLVRVWLGKTGSDFFETLTEADVESLHRFYISVNRILEHPEETRESLLDFLSTVSKVEHRQDLDTILQLLSRPWFSRMWVIQELLAAKAVEFHVGHFKLDLKEVLLVAYCPKMTKGLSFILVGRPANPLQHGLGAASSLAELKLLYSGGKSLRLSELVRRTGLFDAAKEKDKIFALVGLASDADEDFIDYGKNIRTVFIDIARNALIKPDQNQAEGLNFLCNVVAPDPLAQNTSDWGVPRALKSANMPSWAPILSTTNMNWGDVQPLSEPWGDLGDECALKAELRFGPDETLHVRGKVVTVPKFIVIETPYDLPLQFAKETQPHFASLARWIKEIQTLAEQALAKENETDDMIVAQTHWFIELSRAFIFAGSVKKSIHQAFHHRLCFHAFSYYVKLMSKNTFSDAFEFAAAMANRDFTAQFGQEAGFNCITEEDVIEYARTFACLSRGRRFAITHSNQLAWVPAATRPGDVIAKLQGLRVPMVLRPNAGSTVVETCNPEGTAFTILGDCYVHGMMFAECKDHGCIILRESHVLVIR